MPTPNDTAPARQGNENARAALQDELAAQFLTLATEIILEIFHRLDETSSAIALGSVSLRFNEIWKLNAVKIYKTILSRKLECYDEAVSLVEALECVIDFPGHDDPFQMAVVRAKHIITTVKTADHVIQLYENNLSRLKLIPMTATLRQHAFFLKSYYEILTRGVLAHKGFRLNMKTCVNVLIQYRVWANELQHFYDDLAWEGYRGGIHFQIKKVGNFDIFWELLGHALSDRESDTSFLGVLSRIGSLDNGYREPWAPFFCFILRDTHKRHSGDVNTLLEMWLYYLWKNKSCRERDLGFFIGEDSDPDDSRLWKLLGSDLNNKSAIDETASTDTAVCTLDS